MSLSRQKVGSPKGCLLRGDSFFPEVAKKRTKSDKDKVKEAPPPASALKKQLDSVDEHVQKMKRVERKNSNIGNSKIGGGGGGLEGTTDDGTVQRVQSMIKKKDRPLIAPRSDHCEKLYTIVLDLDETLVFSRDGPLMARAYAKHFLQTLQKYFEVVVWTAGDRSYARAVINEINIDNIIEHVVYRHKIWYNVKDYTKDLRLLGRDLDYLLIIENTPDCMRVNPENGILVQDYEGDDEENDHTLLRLSAVLEELGTSGGVKVPQFLAQCRLLKKQKVECNENLTLPLYFVSTKRHRRRKEKKKEEKGGGGGGNKKEDDAEEEEEEEEEEKKVVKVNRDKGGGVGVLKALDVCPSPADDIDGGMLEGGAGGRDGDITHMANVNAAAVLTEEEKEREEEEEEERNTATVNMKKSNKERKRKRGREAVVVEA